MTNASSIQLPEWMRQDLLKSCIDPVVACEGFGYHPVDPGAYPDLLGFGNASFPAGYCIPYYDAISGQPMRTPDGRPFVRIKLEKPVDLSGNPAKYLTARQAGQHAYIPWGSHPLLINPTLPIILTEGEKKALRTFQASVPAIGLSGNWGFTQSSTGDLLDELKPYATPNRNWYVIWDSDALINYDFAAATNRLRTFLQARRVNLNCIVLPTSDMAVKVGLDDYLCAHPVDDLIVLLQSANPVDDTAEAIYEKWIIRLAKEIKA